MLDVADRLEHREQRVAVPLELRAADGRGPRPRRPAGAGRTRRDAGELLVRSAHTLTEAACTSSSAIEASFNSRPIAEGGSIWFNSAIRVNGLGSDPATIFLNDATITFAANGENYSLAVPGATIVFDPAATAATTSFDAASSRWSTIVPSGLSGKTCFCPAGLCGSGRGSARRDQIGHLVGGVFDGHAPCDRAVAVGRRGLHHGDNRTDYNGLAVKAADDGQSGQGSGQPSQGASLMSRPEDNGSGQMDFAGKPASVEAFVTAGAGGDGGSDFTGSFRAMSRVTPCAAGASAQPRSRTRTTITRNGAGTDRIDITTGLAITKTCVSPQPPNTLFSCSYSVQNLDPDNTVTGVAVTNQVPCTASGIPGLCGAGSGAPVAAQCEFPVGTPVTTLQKNGTPGDTCTGSLHAPSSGPACPDRANSANSVRHMSARLIHPPSRSLPPSENLLATTCPQNCGRHSARTFGRRGKRPGYRSRRSPTGGHGPRAPIPDRIRRLRTLLWKPQAGWQSPLEWMWASCSDCAV